MTFETMHGHSLKKDTPEYRTFVSWMSMRWRCYNKNRKDYPRYGGRGIKVCAEWRDNYLAFLSDMGLKPDGGSLGRIDNDLGYSPTNCRWETPTQQARNKSSNHRLSHKGKSLTITEWANDLGLSKSAIQKRLAKGWTIGDVLTRPGKAQKNSRCKWVRNISEMKERVLSVVRKRPATSRDIANELGLSIKSACDCLADLREAGLIKKTGAVGMAFRQPASNVYEAAA